MQSPLLHLNSSSLHSDADISGGGWRWLERAHRDWHGESLRGGGDIDGPCVLTLVFCLPFQEEEILSVAHANRGVVRVGQVFAISRLG